MQENKPLSRRSDLVTQEVGTEILIYDLSLNKAFNLNQTSAMIWQLCDGNRTISEIARNLSGKLDTNISEDFVRLALDQLGKDNLLENSSEFIFSSESITRRDVIRKIGFSTLVALPIVSSLIAPTATHAQSCGATNRPNGCSCLPGGSSSCTSGCCGSNGTSAICVAGGQDGLGSSCRAACECASNCCTSTSLTGTCVAFKTLTTGQPCTVACQCQNTCSGGLCT